VNVEGLSRSEAETLQLAARLARQLSAGDVVCLEGPLGSGKTCFVRGLATGLGLDPTAVNSPTFVICQRYQGTGTALALVHLDAFRLAGPDDLESVGWEELLETPDTVIAVEWPSRIAAALPPRRINVVMTHVDQSTRRIAVDTPPEIAFAWEGTDA